MSLTGPVQETEAQFTQAVIEYAKLRGWLVAHFRPAQTAKGYRTPMQGDVGYPDLTMARTGRVVFAELKAEKAPKKLPDGQQAWKDALQGMWVADDGSLNVYDTAYVWRPSDWDQVLEVLK